MCSTDSAPTDPARAPALSLRTTAGQFRLDALAPDLIRLRITHPDRPEPDRSYAVVPGAGAAPPVEIREAEGRINIATARASVEVRPVTGRFSVHSASGVPLMAHARIAWEERGFTLEWEQPANRRVYGCGEQAGPLERRGGPLMFWNTDHYEYAVGATSLYHSIPFCLTLDDGDANGLLLDNTFRQEWSLGAVGDTAARIRVDGGAADLYFFTGGTPSEVLARLTGLIGRMDLPPLWGIGFHQSRYSYYPESQVMEIADSFRDRRIPCDALYLDIHYMDEYKSFTWDRERFPDPGAMIARLREKGFHVVTIIDPGVKAQRGYAVHDELLAAGFHLRNPDGTPYVAPVWPGDCIFPDFTTPDCRAWWGGLHTALLNEGVAGIWNDMNEPAIFETETKTAPLETLHEGDGFADTHRRYHNVYGLLMSRATREGLVRLRPDRRPFVLSRAGYTGSQRYAATWTGDNIASWEHFRMSIPMVLNLGLSGQGFSGSDIGGFIGDPTPELFARWLQAGALLPYCRVHSARASHDVIHAEGAAPQEPWSFGPEWEKINRASIARRYLLLPYLYTTFEEMTRTGTPMARPMLYHDPGDTRFVEVDDQFMLGPHLLVAPVVHEGGIERDVLLPEGSWRDFETGACYAGGGTVRVKAPVDTLPIFVRAGAAIPTFEGLMHTGEAANAPIVWRVYPDERGRAEGTMYEDNGDSLDYTRGDFRRFHIIVTMHKGMPTIETVSQGTYLSLRPAAELKVIGQ